MLPADLTAPFTSLLSHRRSRRDLLLAATLIRALTLGLTAVGVGIGAPFGPTSGFAATAAACLLAAAI
jgi:hypothetical protein